MWIIYRLWVFLLLKPALGVLQIPAQSVATQSSLFSYEFISAPFPTVTTTRHVSDMTSSFLSLRNFADPQLAVESGIYGISEKDLNDWSGRRKSLISHFLNDRAEEECNESSTENRHEVGKCGGEIIQRAAGSKAVENDGASIVCLGPSTEHDLVVL